MFKGILPVAVCGLVAVLNACAPVQTAQVAPPPLDVAVTAQPAYYAAAEVPYVPPPYARDVRPPYARVPNFNLERAVFSGVPSAVGPQSSSDGNPYVFYGYLLISKSADADKRKEALR